MLTFILYLSSLLLLLLSFVHGAPLYTPTENILLNCGSSSKDTSPDGRNWESDTDVKFSPFNRQRTSSSAATELDPSLTQVPYMTARISNSPFTYIIPISSGPKFVRFYFYPATYSGLDKSKFFFSIIANRHTLLSNFSAFLTVSATYPPAASIVKEFCINVPDYRGLTITFYSSPSAYAFINGIEIVSMPYNLYRPHKDNLVPVVNFHTFFTLDDTTALETLYRLNVGGQDLSVNDDTGMFRIWRDDSSYIWGAGFGVTHYQPNVTIQYTPETPAYTAPAIVYSTARTMGQDYHVNLNCNLTWIFTVDSGFNYLVRLHFCETQLDVTLPNQRVFRIYINNQTAQKELDVIESTGGTEIPMYRDYVVLVQDSDGSRSKQDLWLALHPVDSVTKPYWANALLNGLEIFKLNRSDGSLAPPNPDPNVVPTSPQPYPKLQKETKSKGPWRGKLAVIGVVLGGVVAFSLLCLLIYRRVRGNGISTKRKSSSLPSGLCRHFTIVELKSATRNFHDNFVVGSGGFGNVYKGFIDRGSTIVAIKRLNPSSKQGAREFQTEIKTLSQLRHLHLVSLIGYCDDDGEMVLVYDYMARGTLRDHLYKNKNPPLPWKQRLEICIGAARGLHYLHTGSRHPIIHRDVKSTNILLDEKWVAKVSDFGLSKMGPISTPHGHISTVVKGSLGYIDPEYYRRQQVTEKSDVYSFGVVLFEVLCGRPAVSPNLPKEQVSLAKWARNSYQRGSLDEIIDPNLKGKIAHESLRKFGEIAYCCVRDHGIERPTMNDVAWTLEFALQLQQDDEKIEEWPTMNDGACTLEFALQHEENAENIDSENGVGKNHIGMNLDASRARIKQQLSIATVLSILGSIIFGRRMKTKSQKNKESSLPQELCRHFTLAEIRTATNNFEAALIIGDGGFGRVYKGYINRGRIPVAIKKLKSKSLQGAHEFRTEIEMLSRLRHLHLVSLIGYCNEGRQMMLVYDYMSHGTLREHLYKTDNPPLSWKKRLEICIGAARGFEYLHAGAEHTIIHRDVKTTNILLDENWVAKVSDFGLSKMGPIIASRSHISTDVKGTFGYLDPEYYWTHHLTEKSDVYAFGVVLFEVLCARAAVDMDLEEEQHSLAQWARHCVKNGTIDQIIDPHLTGKIAPDCLRVFTVIADKCIREKRNERPKIGEVVWSLEFALELQESVDAAEEGIMIDGAHREMSDERMLSYGDRNQMGLRPPNVDDVAYSCPEFWQKDYGALNRCSSDKTGLKWADSPTCPGPMESCLSLQT